MGDARTGLMSWRGTIGAVSFRRIGMILVTVASAAVLAATGVVWATGCLADPGYSGSTP